MFVPNEWRSEKNYYKTESVKQSYKCQKTFIYVHNLKYGNLLDYSFFILLYFLHRNHVAYDEFQNFCPSLNVIKSFGVKWMPSELGMGIKKIKWIFIQDMRSNKLVLWGKFKYLFK